MCKLVGYLGEHDAASVLHQFLYHCNLPDHEGTESCQIKSAIIDGRKLSEGAKGKTKLILPNGNGNDEARIHLQEYFVLDNQGNIECPKDMPSIVIDHILSISTKNSKTDMELLRKSLGPDAKIGQTDCMHRRGEVSISIINHAPSKEIIAMRCGGPPIFTGFRNDGFLITSDIDDVLAYTKHYRVLEDNEAVLISWQGATFMTLDGRPLRRVLYDMREDLLCAKILTIDTPSNSPSYPMIYPHGPVHLV